MTTTTLLFTNLLARQSKAEDFFKDWKKQGKKTNVTLDSRHFLKIELTSKIEKIFGNDSHLKH